ncbi:MAG TPA: ABC transporter ATP-binding protein [Elusimicrobiales bacterium]|nr:ABC transporter ATP-binding protein [Elusimicrobiales bacterium]
MIKLGNLDFQLSSGFSLEIGALNVREGEVLSIIGPNGAGKTTLLNIFALLQEIRTGSLEIMGRDAREPANKISLRRAMSYVFSRPYLADDTVANNVALPLKFRGLRDAGRTAEMLELFKITGLRDRNANQLSQGERHRVSLARAFVTRPRLVLLDEPFSSLDARVRETIICDLRKIIRAAGTTVLLVTQDQGEALALADTLAVMKAGRLLQRAGPAEIFARPASKDVADFVGVETILPGTVTKNEDNLCSVEAGGKTLEVIADCAPGDGVYVCVRPEHVSVSRTPEAGSMRNHLSAKIVSVEPWGLEYKAGLDCGFSLMAAVTKQSVDALGLKPGLEVFASFKATAAHLIKR